ncbi:MAG: 1,2-phenylacetyl-CoA epoxidase subunit PaaD [Acidimicrobiales bacterium]|jgi:ring-1,2-phenylacetyl-CoA epoxidase subunit PaaD
MTVSANGLTATEEIARIAGSVEDPELPHVTIGELGILRAVVVDEHGHAEVELTPTYSGCPAVEVIEGDVRAALADAGYADVSVRRVLSPPWTTDWITPEGRRKLAAGGIAPPASVCAPVGDAPSQPVAFVVRCPHCGSPDTELVSPFGSTACKALRRCRSCAEPFDHFKPF